MQRKNKIKDEIFHVYSLVKKGERYEKILQYQSHIQYDQEGRKKKHKTWHGRISPGMGKPVRGEFVTDYDGKRIVEEREYLPLRSLFRKEIYNYDERDRLDRVSTFDKSKPIYNIQFSYGDNGKPTEMIETCGLTGDKSIHHYSYDGTGHMVCEKEYDVHGNPVHIITYVYNGQGRKAYEIRKTALGVKREVIAYRYNENGELIQQKEYNPVLKELTEYIYIEGKYDKKVVQKSYHFQSDCMGVRMVPCKSLETQYKYY